MQSISYTGVRDNLIFGTGSRCLFLALSTNSELEEELRFRRLDLRDRTGETSVEASGEASGEVSGEDSGGETSNF